MTVHMAKSEVSDVTWAQSKRPRRNGAQWPQSPGVNGSACQSQFAARRGIFAPKENGSTLPTDPTQERRAGTQNHCA